MEKEIIVEVKNMPEQELRVKILRNYEFDSAGNIKKIYKAPETPFEKVIFERSDNTDGADKTSKGKSYTKEQCKSFEEQEYQAYLNKRKGFFVR